MKSRAAPLLGIIPMLFSLQAAGEQITDSTGKNYLLESAISLASQDDVLVLDRRCNAFSKRYGKGCWTWSNGGFRINFNINTGNEVSIGFFGDAPLNVQGKCREQDASSRKQSVAVHGLESCGP